MSNCDFPIPKEEYLAFDSLSIKQHIKDRLNESGVFTDQNYEGSYVSTIIDIVAYTFNTLMFYLNQTSTGSMYSDADIYENMNRIVKLIDYKPIGNQTSTLSFEASALGTGATSTIGVYTIPRYAYFQVDGNQYSFNEDISFTKQENGTTEALTDLSNQKLLYQGKYIEYPVQTATGDENEIVYLAPGENIVIDHFNIDIYIKTGAESWEKWENTPSLYLETAAAKKYEIRFNENMNYEIKFGNNINGKKLQTGTQVAIYYLRSLGSDGEVGANALAGQKVVEYSTIQYDEILADVTQGQITFLTNFSSLLFDNNSVSTFSSQYENADSIRENAPGVFRSQYRLVTSDDYDLYVKTNYANLIHDVNTVNNWKYLSEQMKYYYDLGITNPNMAARVVLNQVLFGDSCNFNNVYITTVPKNISTTNPIVYLSPAQKELIISSMRSEKTLTAEIIITDPVYVATALAVSNNTDNADKDDITQTELVITKDPNSRRDNSSIINDVTNVFTTYFNKDNTTLGKTIDVKEINSSILSINGVKEIYTARKDNPNIKQEGVSLLIWNPIHNKDTITVINDITLPYFKYVYLYDASEFSNNIRVQSTTKIYENIEY